MQSVTLLLFSILYRPEVSGPLETSQTSKDESSDKFQSVAARTARESFRDHALS